jgi:hypothetical protein
MPNYTEQERSNLATAAALFDAKGPADKSTRFAEDAIWWNGLPMLPGAPGQTEHKGRDAIRRILTGAGASKSAPGIDAYDLSTARYEDVVILADGDYVMRQQTYRAKTWRGRDYCNVCCFVFKMNAQGQIQYLTEHWNTWHAHNFLFNQYELEPAHPEGREH